MNDFILNTKKLIEKVVTSSRTIHPNQWVVGKLRVKRRAKH